MRAALDDSAVPVRPRMCRHIARGALKGKGVANLSILGDVLLQAAKVEADDLVELRDIAVLELGEADVRDGAHAELARERLAVLNVALDESDVRVLSGELREFAEEPLARATPRGEEIDNAEATGSLDLLLELVIGVLAHDVKVSWRVRHLV